MTLWFGMSLLFPVAFFSEMVRAKGSSSYADEWSFLPVGLMFFGISLVNVGVWMSRLSEPKVIDFLRNTVGVVSNSPGVPIVGEITIQP